MTTKTAALAAAKSAVTMYRSGSSWTITGPYKSTHEGLSGMTTSLDKPDFFSARRARTLWIASLALSLMGWTSEDAEYATYDRTGSADEIVSAALDARKTA